MLRLPLPALLLAVPLAAFAAGRPPLPRPELEAHVRFLADDLLEGRGLGVRGGELAAAYIESQLRAAGLSPAFGDSFRQPLALRRAVPDKDARLELRAAGGTVELAYARDFVAAFPFPAAAHEGEADLVFAGYGIVAPELRRDDYRGADVRGKIVVLLAGQPKDASPDGRTLTIYGRWTYKFEEAARHGARGALIVHTTAGAGYDWNVVRNSWSGGSYFDPERTDLPELEGWVTEEAGTRLFEAGGFDPAALRRLADGPEFRPRLLGLRARFAARGTYEEVRTANVAGLVPGRLHGDPARRRAIVVSAHYDHLGVRPGDDGVPAVYHGAIDNGTALALLLALARDAAERPGTLDSDLIFFAPTAEEVGLIGSAVFARRPPLPAERIVADVNLEMSAPWGRARNITALGADGSELAGLVAALAERNGLRVSPDAAPEQGFLFRSDQYSFLREGIPAVWLDLGDDLEEGGLAAGRALREGYRAERYHRPADRFDPSWSFAGLQQLGDLARELIASIDARGDVRRRR